MKITGLRASKRGNRIQVYIDDKYAVSVDSDVLLSFDLYNGKEISGEAVKNIKTCQAERDIYQKSLKMIARRRRSEFEIRQYIKRTKGGKNVDQDAIIDKLKKGKFIDDTEFATWWVRNRIEFKPRGKYRLRLELFKKGIDKEVIRTVLETEYPKPEKVVEIAKQLAEKKIRTMGVGIDDMKQKRKLWSYLQRRGFSSEIIKKVVNMYLNSSDN